MWPNSVLHCTGTAPCAHAKKKKRGEGWLSQDCVRRTAPCTHARTSAAGVTAVLAAGATSVPAPALVLSAATRRTATTTGAHRRASTTAIDLSRMLEKTHTLLHVVTQADCAHTRAMQWGQGRRRGARARWPIDSRGQGEGRAAAAMSAFASRGRTPRRRRQRQPRRRSR
jgi:hypothetical protein